MRSGISKFKFYFLFPIVLFATILASTPPAYAIPVEDIPASIWRAIKDVIGKSGSQIFNSVLTTAVNQLAYDYATYLGSGASGQKPFFEQKPLGDRILEAGDAALGQFVEDVAENGLWTAKRNEKGEIVRDDQGKPIMEKSGDINICSPDIFALNKITLGLTDYGRPSYETGSCSFSQLRSNWENEFDQITSIINDKDYLKKVSGYFDPGGNDIAISYELFNRASEEMIIERSKKQQEAEENGGWLRVEGLVSGKYQDAPAEQARRAEQVRDAQTQSIGKTTGDIFVDAANIFLNQLALSAFNKLMSSIGSDTNTNGGGAGDQFAQGGNGGVTQVNRRVNTLLQAQFSERSDYDVIGQLTSCTDEEKPGPTNCVITQQFAQAITRQLTVAKALEQKLLNGEQRIGFNEQGNEFSYRDGYPYRSLIILRKYRVLPVGWEVAAQYIKAHPQETKEVTLDKLLQCYSATDTIYPGFHANWCNGLIDPNWVLEIPKLYCGMEGYGSEIMNASLAPSSIGYCTKTVKGCSGQSAVGDCASNFQRCNVDADCNIIDPNYPSCNFTVGREPIVTRTQNYCADEQSCIKENANGSCASYGYCTEEQRRWVFNQQRDNSCEARNNTCQIFSGNGKTVSYLENTLDYGNCGPNEVGCARYATNGTYNTTTKGVNWATSSVSKYLNKNAETCDPDKEGCHQFIRSQDGGDTNLIADGSFEGSQCIGNGGGSETLLPQDKFNPLVKTAFAQTALGDCQLTTLNSSGTLPSPNGRWYIRVNSGSVKAGIVNDKADHGSQSLYIEGAGGIYSKDNVAPTLLPSGFAFEADRFYTLTATVYVTAGKVRIGFGGANGQSAESTATEAWQNLIVNYYRTANGATDFYVEGVDAGAKFYIDELKISVGNALTTYGDYFAKNVIYQKLLPEYLEAACYESVGGDAPGTSNYRYKANAPSECFNFARKCNADEVGCEQYTSLNTGISVTGKVKPKDYCPGTCIGYDVFVEQPTYFSAASSQYFIPTTAESCSAQATGCTAFTNLDKLSEGGEAVEYYTYLRSCIKPDVASCGEFYTWEGSDESGFQLKVYSLKQNGTEPASTMTPEEEALVCNEEIFKKSPSEPGYNYDCREFYNRDGQVSYHLYTRTISCSEDCHPYRREVASQAECEAGNGTWDITQSRCLYYAIPNQGTTCSAPEVGCREYTGNIANDTRTVLNDTFENSALPTDNWGGGSQSNNSLNLGGHSLLGTNLSKTIGSIVTRDQSYTISFLAKVQSGNAVLSSIDLVNKDNQAAVFSTGSNVNITSEWKIYTFNLAKLDHEVTPIPSQGDAPDQGEKLRINFSQPIYIDNIVLTEVPDRYYLIKDSWTTPDECDQTVTGAYSPRYMLGCSQYRDRNNTTVNLHSFSQLCQDSAAGCEQMIDTQNSGDYRKRLYNDTNGNGICEPAEASCVEIKADEMINVVYDRTKECNSSDKGCSRYGKASDYDNQTIYANTYVKDNPDTYNTTLCSANAVGCSQWSTGSNSIVYFKDPEDMVCEWRLRKNSTPNDFAWFKKKIKRCGGITTGSICSSSSDCSANQGCSLVDVDEVCDVSDDKTVGSGGSGGRTKQPATWAGACEAAQSGCTEYIDPTSKFNENLILNPDFRNLDSDPPIEYWTNVGANEAQQTVSLTAQTIYILKGAGDNNAAKIKIRCPSGNPGANERLRVLNSSNDFAILTDTNNNPIYETREVAGGTTESLEFYIQSPNTGQIQCTITRSNRTEGQSVYLRRAVVEYQLEQNLDRASSNGLVNFDSGSILFNERAQNGSQKQALVYNADATFDTPVDGSIPQTTNPKNANVLLTVKPDRTCAKWLSCLTYIPDPNNPNKKICLDVGLCDKLGPDGTCANFINNTQRQNQYPGSLTNIANLSGYSKVGYVEAGSSLTFSDYYNIASMSEVGESVEIANGGFEDSGGWVKTTGEPQILNQPGQISSLNLAPFHLVKNQNSSGFLAPEGRGLLKLTTNSKFTQGNAISLISGRRYVITFYSYATGDGLKVKFESTTGSGSFDLDAGNSSWNNTKNVWVKQTISIKAGSPSYKIALEKTGGGEAYIDDLRLDPGLNFRCSDPANSNSQLCNDPTVNPKPEFIGSSCRLYAKDNSLACNYTDSDSVTHRGIYGYCLEKDPRDQSACLLWYPTSRVAGDGAEEGTNVNFGNDDVYYCLDAKDQCSGNDTAFYCNQFVKVNKGLYWNRRMSAGASFTLPNPPNFNNDPFFYPTDTRKIDFGAKGGTVTINSIGRDSGGQGYYGSYLSSTIPGSNKLPVTRDVSGNINSFLPYYGSVSANPNNLCGRDEVSSGEVDADETWTDIQTAEKYDYCYNLYGEGDEGDGPLDGYGFCRGGGHNPECPSLFCNQSTAYNFEDNCGDNNYVQCRVNQLGSGFWNMGIWDQNTGGDDQTVECRFDCYDKVKSYNLAKSNALAFDAVRRLFSGRYYDSVSGQQFDAGWTLYTWNGSSYGSTPYSGNSGNMPRCTNDTRPAYPNDYCYIPPQISDVRVDGLNNSDIIITGSKDATLSFNTLTDPEQLPIKRLEIDWGYKNSLGQQETRILQNLADINPRSITHRFDYFIINNTHNQTANICDENTQCVIKPRITITDNWGHAFEISFSRNIIVKNPAN